MMPYRTSSPESRGDAEAVVADLGCASELVDISPMVDAYFERARRTRTRRRCDAATSWPAARMMVLYDRSVTWRGLVIGTGNKTETLIGYTTLFGDSACALRPSRDLYKTQVRQLSVAIGVPDAIVRKAPSRRPVAGPDRRDRRSASATRRSTASCSASWTGGGPSTRWWRRASTGRSWSASTGWSRAPSSSARCRPSPRSGPRTAGVDYLYPRRRPRSTAWLTRRCPTATARCTWSRRPSATWATSPLRAIETLRVGGGGGRRGHPR